MNDFQDISLIALYPKLDVFCYQRNKDFRGDALIPFRGVPTGWSSRLRARASV